MLYSLDSNQKQDVCGYCANFILVENEFGFKINIPKKYVILIQSNYLDERTDDSRTKFTIKGKRQNVLNSLSWQDIEEVLKKELQQIFNCEFKDMEEKNKKSLDEAMDKFPFFKKNFGLITTNTVGYISAKDYVSGSYSLLEKLEKNFRKLQIKSLDNTLTNDEFTRLIESSSLALADYVVNRKIIINQMQKYIDENTNDEKKIHNLLTPRGEIYGNDNNELVDLNECNLWLIDDKFMSFSKSFSDKKLKEIKKQLGEYNQRFTGENQEPDLVIYFDTIDKTKMVI